MVLVWWVGVESGLGVESGRYVFLWWKNGERACILNMVVVKFG